MSSNNLEGIDLDAILYEIGPFGVFQIRNYFLIVLSIIVAAMYNSQYVFNAGQPNQRCKVPECEKSPPEFKAGDWKNWAIPSAPNKARCYRFFNKDSQCSADSFTKELRGCDSWLYENKNSIVGEFDMGCQEWKRTLVGSIHSFGLMTALAFIGTFSDRFGRRWTFIITSAAPALVGLVRAFSINYYMYLVLEYLEAVSDSGAYSTGYILALEMVGIEKRVIAGSGIACFFALGQALEALAAWLIPYWRLQTVVIYVPSILFIFYYYCLVESVRWLLSKGRNTDAVDIIFKAAAVNGRTLSPETIRLLTSEASKRPRLKTNSGLRQRCIEETTMLCRSRILLSRLFIGAFWFAAVAFVYYGLSINSVSLSGDKHVNYALLALIEIPGYAINMVCLDRYGRKKCIMISYFICAVSLMVIPFITIDWLIITLSMIAKMFISMVFSATYVYVVELVPTEKRHTMMGTSLLLGRIGSIAAPLSPLLMQVSPILPYIMFSLLAWCAGFLTCFTPETLRRNLPDTVLQAERLKLAQQKFQMEKKGNDQTTEKS